MTNRSANALFHSKTFNNALRHFTFPADLEVSHQKVQGWITALEAGTLGAVKEVSLHGDFLRDIFQEVLGYRSVISGGGKAWEIHAEQTIADGGGSADGALGFFTAPESNQGKVKLQGRVIAPIELKGTKEDLDRPAPGRRESAIEQGWRYANYTPDCKWVIVSNYRELRLYQTTKTPAYYEQFWLEDLADRSTFKRFYFLLCRQNFLPQQNTPKVLSVIDQLLIDSNEAQEEITKQLYHDYEEVRLRLVRHFRFAGPQEIPNRDFVLIEKAQKTLDRILFIAFCEDKGLLPQKTLSHAHDHKDPYNPRSIWENYKSVFRWVDLGKEDPPIPGYNGGLFQSDPILDEQLTVPDPLCSQLNRLTRFDFDTEVSVDILGHIFEQSITDLEALRAETAGQNYDKKKSQRKTQGVFYTPAWVTQYIVAVSLGRYLKQREQEMRDVRPAKGDRHRNIENDVLAEIQVWETYRDEVLQKTRVIDPACGSGAFLIAAFDYLIGEYERVNQALATLKGEQQHLSDLDRTILSHNLYGVDLSPESVEITKLSLWLKTAERGKTLTYLDDNIKVGNSIVADPEITDRCFDWEAEFPQIFANGGFDVAIGNPPYVRQELLSAIKPYLQEHYESFNGVADLYTYFYEKGLKILKPGGVLSYIVTNKWLRSGYGEPLRHFFAHHSVFEQIIDFGHAPIFQDADTFPCIVAVRKPNPSPALPETEREPDTSPRFGGIEGGQLPVTVCPVPRDRLTDINLTQYIQQEGYQVPWSRFAANAWSLERPAVDDLMHKIQQVGIPLKDFAGVKPCYGIKTGLNEAFLIDEVTKNILVQTDPKSAEIIKPYLRGQDIKRWHPEWKDLWLIFTRRGIDIDVYPAVKAHLNHYREQLDPRPKDWDQEEDGRWLGRKPGSYQWYEIQDSIDYWQMFEKPKLTYQEIQFHSVYSFDSSGYFTNNKAFIFPNADFYVLAILNSPLMWWHNWRYLPHMKDDALSPVGELMEDFPIAPSTNEIRAEVEPMVSRLIEITKANQEGYRDVLDWLRVTYQIEKPGQKLEDFARLDRDGFVAEIRKRIPRGTSKGSDRLGPAGLKAAREVYGDYALPIQARRSEALKLEQRLSDLVNQAYGLTPEEIDLMWKTAPPRMPIRRSQT